MKITLYILICLLIVFILIILRYRLVYTKIIKGESEVKYVLIQLGQYDFFRSHFEFFFFNKRRLYLKTKLNDLEWLYVSQKYYDKLQLKCKSLSEMRINSYTYKFTFETKCLIFGGYSCAKIISIEKVNHKPDIWKS